MMAANVMSKQKLLRIAEFSTHVSKSARPATFGTPFRWSARPDLMGASSNAAAIWARSSGCPFDRNER
jgi:hypothetical protein